MRIATILFGLAIAFTWTACGDKGGSSGDDDDSANEEGGDDSSGEEGDEATEPPAKLSLSELPAPADAFAGYTAAESPTASETDHSANADSFELLQSGPKFTRINTANSNDMFFSDRANIVADIQAEIDANDKAGAQALMDTYKGQVATCRLVEFSGSSVAEMATLSRPACVMSKIDKPDLSFISHVSGEDVGAGGFFKPLPQPEGEDPVRLTVTRRLNVTDDGESYYVLATITEDPATGIITTDLNFCSNDDELLNYDTVEYNYNNLLLRTKSRSISSEDGETYYNKSSFAASLKKDSEGKYIIDPDGQSSAYLRNEFAEGTTRTIIRNSSLRIGQGWVNLSHEYSDEGDEFGLYTRRISGVIKYGGQAVSDMFFERGAVSAFYDYTSPQAGHEAISNTQVSFAFNSDASPNYEISDIDDALLNQISYLSPVFDRDHVPTGISDSNIVEGSACGTEASSTYSVDLEIRVVQNTLESCQLEVEPDSIRGICEDKGRVEESAIALQQDINRIVED